MENFNERKHRQAQPSKNRNNAGNEHTSRGFVPERPERKFRHCTCEGEALALKNQRLLALLREQPRGFDDATGAPSVLVITQRFRIVHARHMRHFVAFLREQNIRYR
tara:strand:- start:916 stop:1236 length:321 start_codon:yes stop_codon:yes gene_type:complete